MNAPTQTPFAQADQRPHPGQRLHRIVVVGGGAGGLELAAHLGDDLGREGKAEILLVDAQATHLWKPLLHEVAAGTLSGDEGALDFLQQAKRHHFRFHLGAMTGLDRSRKEIALAPLLDTEGREIAPARSLWFDTLVMAVGCQDNDFGIPGVREHAFSLNGAEEAEAFHRRLLALMTSAEMTDRGPVHVVIVGGGATGVELAAELAEATREIVSYGSRLRAYELPVHISLIERADRLLSVLPEFVGLKAANDLRGQGVEVRLGYSVSEIRPNSVMVGRDERSIELESDLTAWVAGIRCPDWLANLGGLETNHLNQLVVTPTLQTSRDSDIFALGDCASCKPDPKQPAVPPKAQAAHQEAAMLAQSLARRLVGKPLSSFTFHDRGSLVTLGHRDAVGDIVEGSHGRTLKLEGMLARTSYWFLYRRHLGAVLGLRKAAMSILGSWLAERAQARVKLH
jgi:NADH dehydrogenase